VQAPNDPAAACKPPVGDAKRSHEACMSHLLYLFSPVLVHSCTELAQSVTGSVSELQG
jgi:hypothetical protein